MWEPEDFENYAGMFAEPDVAHFVTGDGRPMSRFDAWRSLSGQIGHWYLRSFGMFAVVDRTTGDFVGCIGPLQPEGWPDFEIGWGLRRKYWGRGYASEAVKACIKHSFTELGREHLISLIDPHNIRAIRVAERVGERLEGTATVPYVPSKKVLQYGLHRKNWSS